MMLFEIFCDPKPVVKTKWCKTHAYNPGKHYEETLRWQIKPFAPSVPLEGPLRVDITFYLPIPKGVSARTRTQMLNGVIYHVKRPDRDNLAYPVVNAMNNLVYLDDSQIVSGDVQKLYGDKPKIVVRITDLT